MYKEVDKLNVMTGWNPADVSKAEVYGLNGISNYIADKNDGSLILYFNGQSYIEKDYTFDCDGYKELVFSVFSRMFPYSGSEFKQTNDYKYSIIINDSYEYLIPLYHDIIDVSFDITGITAINNIKIKSLSDDEDYLFISAMYVSKAENPLDFFQSFKNEVQNEVNSLVGTDYLLGTITGGQNDTEIYFADSFGFALKYSVIKITDGTHTEYHQIDENTETFYKFTGLYDGTKLLYDYTDANVYLYFPVEFGKRQSEIILPGVSIYGFNGKPIYRNNKLDTYYKNYTPSGNIIAKQDGQIYEWQIVLDCEARQDELLMLISEACRNVIARQVIWCGGRKFEIDFLNDPVYVDVVQSYNEIPKVQYQVKIEWKEEIWRSNLQPTTSQTNLTTAIM